MAKWLVFALAGATFSCADEPRIELTEIAIADWLPEHQQAAVVDAAEAWFERLPARRVPVYVTDYAPNVVPGNWCEDGLVGETSVQFKRLRIEICPGMREPTKSVALHEIGHALAGRPGHLRDGVMAPMVDNYSQEITMRDFEFVIGTLDAELE